MIIYCHIVVKVVICITLQTFGMYSSSTRLFFKCTKIHEPSMENMNRILSISVPVKRLPEVKIHILPDIYSARFRFMHINDSYMEQNREFEIHQSCTFSVSEKNRLNRERIWPCWSVGWVNLLESLGLCEHNGYLF